VAGHPDGGVDVPPGKFAIGLTVAPALLNLPIGGTGRFSATLTYNDGTTADVSLAASWSTDSMLAVPGTGGVVRANFAGVAHITARYGAFSAQGTVVVMTSISLVAITLDPPIVTLPIGGVAHVSVIGTFSDGSTADVTATAVIRDDGGGVVQTQPGGVVVALKAGVATVFATVGSQMAKMTVVVTPATVVSITVFPPVSMVGVGVSTRFTATALLSDGTFADITAAAAWAPGDMFSKLVAPGVYTGVFPGTSLVGAKFGGQVGTARLVVTGATLQALQIDPVDPVVGVGVEIDFRATGLFSDGTRADVTTQVDWASSSPFALPIDGTGRAFSKAVGTSVVTATLGPFVAASTVTITPANLVSISVSAQSSTLLPGGSTLLQAVGNFSDGSMVDITGSVTWSTAPPGVVAVSNAPGTAGSAIALAPGIAVVTATSGMISGATKILVSAATLVKLAILPSSIGVPVGASTRLTAQGGFSDGSVRDVTGQVTWSSSDPTVATIASGPGVGGTVTGVSAGMVVITATLGGVVANATVGVIGAQLQSIAIAPANATLMAGTRAAYTATGTFSDGSVVDVTSQVTWSTDDPTVAAISNVAGASGQLFARAAGKTIVSATLGGVTGQTVVAVTGPMAGSLVISPIAPSTPLGAGVQFTATLVLTDGTVRNVTGLATWSSMNPMVAIIGRTGRATPVAAGSTVIGASYMGFTASTTLTVSDAVPTSIQLTPVEPTMAVGTVTQFAVTALMSDGTTRDVTGQSTFQSDAPDVVGITTGPRMMRGRATAVAAGSATITATYMGFTDMTTVTVTDAVVVQISVSPTGLTLPVGARRQFTAQAIRSDGTSMPVTGLATWISDAPGVAAVSPTGGTRGQVTALSGGTATISATYMGVTGTATVTVTAATLTMVQVTPFNPTIPLDMSAQFVATAIFSDGTNVPVTGMATWLSSDMNVAQVSNAAGSRGLARALGAGATKISATYMNVTGTTTLSVTDATVVQVQVTPFAPSIPNGFDLQLSATAIYSDATSRDVTALATWTSGAPFVADVSDAAATKGLVSTFSAGAATITAQYAGMVGSANVTVSAATLKSITIAPPNVVVAVGAQQSFTALGSFDDGSSLDVTTFVTWTSSDLSVCDVSNADGSRGEATAFGPGTATIQAQRATVTATTTLTAQ
jgi:hypothetical protein